MISKIRLWKSNYDESTVAKSLEEIDQKYNNFTHVQIDAQILSITEEDDQKVVGELEFSDLSDILIVEAIKDKDFVF